MATIEELLGRSVEDLERMTDDELLAHMKDSISLEPKPLPRPLAIEEAERMEEEDPCPIKKPKKKTPAKKITPKDTLDEAAALIRELGI